MDTPKDLRDAYSLLLGERIKQVRGKLTQGEFATRLAVHANTVSKLERGESVLDAFAVTQLAKEFGVDPMWLLTGEKRSSQFAERSLQAVEQDGYIYVPHFDVQMSAGNGAFSDIETVIAMRPFDAKFIRYDLGVHHLDLALVSVVGRSMEPMLHSRDTTLLDLRARDVHTEGVHAIRLDGALMIKMVQRLPGRVLRVSSANAEYSPFEISADEDNESRDFQVLGRCRWAGVVFN